MLLTVETVAFALPATTIGLGTLRNKYCYVVFIPLTTVPG